MSNSALFLQNFDNVPSHLLSQLQACGARFGYIDESFERSSPNSLPDGMVMPEVLRRSESSLEGYDVAPLVSDIPPTQANRDCGTWPTDFPSYGVPASVGDLGIVQQAASRSSNHSSPDATVKTADEPLQRKPKKHWSSVQRRRVPHHVIERRYRDNLNGQIEKLRTCIPSLAAEGCSYTSDLEDDPTPAKCPSKASVIVSAQMYIKELEEQQARLQSNTRALREQVTGLQKLVRCDDCSVVKYLNSVQLNRSISVQ